ncbi:MULTISPECIES: acyltransferase [Morganella]|uniref:acyltransferase n=1 Tax=Morganella TaxID=581 RepID=UPI00339BBF94
MLYKLKWFLSALFLSLFCKKIKFPSYFSIPIFSIGLKKVSIGRRVRIFPGSRFEVHNNGFIQIEDNVGIGQNFHITSAGTLIIGKGTIITGNVCITNIVHEYREIDKPILEQGILVKDTIIGKNCFIGYAAIIQAGTNLGDHCIVGAHSVVSGEFPSYCVIAGTPAKIIKKFDFGKNEWVRIH